MTTKTRYFMLGSLSLMVAGLCTGLVAYYGGFPSLAARTGPDELRYVPADAAVVGYANVRQVMQSDFRQRLHQVVPHHDRDSNEFEAKTGINVERDVDEVVAYMRTVPGGENQHPTGMVIVRGRFDAVRLEALAREHHARVEDYKGKRLLLKPLTPPSAEPDKAAVEQKSRRRQGDHPALAFLEPGLVGIGDEETLRRAIDISATSGQSVTTNEEIMGLVEGVERASNAWAVGRFDAIAGHAKLPQAVSAQLPAIRYFVAAGHVNGGVSGSVRAETRDDQSAENLRDVVRGFLALAKLQAGSKPEMQAALQSLQLTGTGKSVAISFTVPAQLIDLFAPKAPPVPQPAQ